MTIADNILRIAKDKLTLGRGLAGEPEAFNPATGVTYQLNVTSDKKALREWLVGEYADEYDTIPSATHLSTATAAITAVAMRAERQSAMEMVKPILHELETATEGREDKLAAAATRLGQLVSAGALSEDTAVSLLETACNHNGLIRDYGADYVVEVGIRDPLNQGEGDDDDSARSQRDQVVELVDAEFTIGRTVDNRAFIIDTQGPNLALFSGSAKSRLAVRFTESRGRTPGRSALDEVWTYIEGRAAIAEPVELPLRCGAAGEGVYILDLGTPDGSCVEVTSDGWRLLERSPITFRRSKATGALPEPVSGGSWDAFWRIVNTAKEDRLLLRGSLASMILSDFPHVIIRITGEHGSAKTTATTYLGRLIDPSPVDTLSPPKSSEKWETTVNARWVVPVDNVSKIDPWWSDDMCRTSTGSGALDRTLFTDSDVSTKFLRACIILNGISMGGALKSDLADRLLSIEFVQPSEYLTEKSIRAMFTEHHAGLLGLVLDDAVTILSNINDVAVPTDLRMADFAQVLAAFDTDALDLFREKVSEASNEAWDTDVLGRCVHTFIENYLLDTWTGTAGELLKELEPIRQDMQHNGEAPTEGGWFPTSGSALSHTLARSARGLRSRGVTFSKSRTKGARTITLARGQGGIAVTPAESPSPDTGDFVLKGRPGDGDDGDDGDSYLSALKEKNK